MTDRTPTTWRECAEAGMSLTAAARLLGKSLAAGSRFAKRHGFAFARDPEVTARNRDRLKALHADPEFAARNRDRMKALNADPEFAARNRDRMKALNADPAHNVLVLLTPEERADYDVLVQSRLYRRAEALRAIGRADLIRDGAES